MITSLTPPGMWEIELPGEEVEWDNQAWMIVQGEPGRSAAHNAFDLLHPDDRDRALEFFQYALRPDTPDMYETEARFLWPDGSVHWCRLWATFDFSGQGDRRTPVRASGFIQDISEHKLSDRLTEGQNEVLRMVTSGRPAEEVFEAVCSLIEKIDSRVRACVLVTDDNIERFERVVGPGFPREFLEPSINCPVSAPFASTCAEAIAERRVIACDDVENDERWPAEWRELMLRHGVGACRSTPVFDSKGNPRASLSLYLANPHQAEPWYDRFIETGKDLITIALEREDADRNREKMEDLLRLSEERLRRALEASGVGLFDVDVATEQVVWDEGFYRICGLSTDLPPGQELHLGHVHPDDREMLLRGTRAARDPVTGGSYRIEFRFIRPDGEMRWIASSARVHYAGEGPDRHAVRVIGTISDITDEKRAEQRLQAGEERHRLALEAAHVGMFDVDIVSGERFWDEGFYQITGLPAGVPRTREQFLSRIHPEDLERANRLFEGGRNPATGGSYRAEYRFIRPDGEVRWLVSNGRVHFAGEGAQRRAVREIGTITDVTDSKLAEQRLREDEERERLALEATRVGTFDFDALSGTLFWNDGFYEITGLPRNEPPALDTYLAHVHPDDANRVSQVTTSSRNPETGGRYQIEYRFVRPDGGIRWISSTARVHFVGQGAEKRPARVIGTIADITDAKHIEHDLREGEERQRLALQATRVGTFDLDLLHGTLFWDEGFYQITGMPRDQVPTTELYVSHVHPDDVERSLSTANAARDPETGGSYQMEYRLVRPDGDMRWISSTGRVHFMGQGEEKRAVRVIGTISDVTEKKQTEQSLHENLERQRLALEATRIGTFDNDLLNGHLFWDDGYYEITGLHRDQPPDADVYWARIHPEDLERTRRVVQAARDPVTGGSFHTEYRFIRPDGAIRWISSTALIHFVGEGEEKQVARIVGTIADVTARKDSERKMSDENARLEERVHERTAELEELNRRLRLLAADLTETEQRERRRLAEIIHDHLQQLLVAARMQVNIMNPSGNSEEFIGTREFISGLLLQAIEEARSLTTQLRPPYLYESGLVSALQWLARWMERAHSLRVELVLDPAVQPRSEQTSVLLFESVRELLLNIAKYAGVNEAEIRLEKANEQRMCLTVRDNGSGFDPGTLTSREHETGGFGLFSIRERMRAIGGEFELESAPGRGVRVRLFAPLEGQ